MDWSIHIANGKGDCPKLTVPSVESFGAGYWNKEQDRLLAPCTVSIAQLLPYRYRKAFNRGAQTFWFAREHGGGRWEHGVSMPYCTLYNARDKFLATLYAIPKVKGTV